MSDDATVTVHGQATAPARPDYLLVQVSVSETATTSAEALKSAGERWEMLTAALDDLRIEVERRSGTAVSLNPSYKATPGELPELAGWTASGRLTVQLASGEIATELLDRVAATPGIQMSSWSWVISAENPAHLEAGKNAVAAARARAEVIAAALGRSLGPLVQASDGDAAGPRRYTYGGQVFMAARVGRAPALPVEEGWSQVMSSVDLTFKLE